MRFLLQSFLGSASCAGTAGTEPGHPELGAGIELPGNNEN